MKIRLGNDIRLKIQLPVDSDKNVVTSLKYIGVGRYSDNNDVVLEDVNYQFEQDREYSIDNLISIFGSTTTSVNDISSLTEGEIFSFVVESESVDEVVTKSYDFSVVKRGERINSRIINARAFFVNDTLKEQLEKEYIKKNRFIGRFPIEPFVNEFQPTPHNINNSGLPKYRAFVHNEYCGFGVNPNWDKCFPFGDKNITVYESKVEYDADGTKIIVTFPAEAQLYPGEYSLVVIGNIYDLGYSGNKRTITVDLSKLFELVSTSEEAGVISDAELLNNPVYIEINKADSNITSQDVYVTAGTYNDDSIILSRNDAHAVNVDVSPITGWYEGQ